MTLEIPFAPTSSTELEQRIESPLGQHELPYLIDNEIYGLGSRAVIEYGDLIKLTTDSLRKTGYNPSRSFDRTIVSWLKSHCETFPTDGITIIAKDSDWDPTWSKKDTPWFNQFETVQKNYDSIRQLVDSSLPTGKRPQVELFIGDRLLWSGLPDPSASS